jgi:quinoprotein glucose dehydrogenase
VCANPDRHHHRQRREDQSRRAATKQGWVYVFDRVTGKPVWPIRNDQSLNPAPGEKTSATQPFPTRPPAFDRQGTSEADLIDFTPEIKARR